MVVKKIFSAGEPRARHDLPQGLRKDEVMLRAVLAKFTQHAGLRDTLLATGDAMLVEHTRNDSYWGDGGDGRGRNMLGQILVNVREELRGTGEVSEEP